MNPTAEELHSDIVHRRLHLQLLLTLIILFKANVIQQYEIIKITQNVLFNEDTFFSYLSFNESQNITLSEHFYQLTYRCKLCSEVVQILSLSTRC